MNTVQRLREKFVLKPNANPQTIPLSAYDPVRLRWLE